MNTKKDDLMLMDDPGPAIFAADPADEYRLTFSVPDLAWPGGRRPLMTMRCFEESKMRGAIVWLGEHQQLWSEWRIIAETDGGNALSARLVKIMAAESLERFGSLDYLYEACLGAVVTRGSSTCDITIAMTLVTRSLPIITHAFADHAAREAFMDHLLWSDHATGAVELAELALLEGHQALAARFDAMALRQRSAGSRTVH